MKASNTRAIQLTNMLSVSEQVAIQRTHALCIALKQFTMMGPAQTELGMTIINSVKYIHLGRITEDGDIHTVAYLHSEEDKS